MGFRSGRRRKKARWFNYAEVMELADDKNVNARTHREHIAPQRIKEIRTDGGSSEYGEREYYLRNTVEETVLRETGKLLNNIEDICRCDRCFSDVCAIVLNDISPKYVTTVSGEVFGKASSLNMMGMSEITVKIMMAIRTVSGRPSH